MKDLIYIAGKLNDESAEYIQNAHRMLEYGEEVRELGCAVHIPANDFLQGIVSGKMTYQEYWDNNIEALLRADAIALTPGWQGSLGTEKEIRVANGNNIPVFYDIDAVKEYVNRPKVLCIIGESGSGKTYMADYIEREYQIPMIRSYTDRPKRTPDEDGHTFLTKEEFDKIDENDMTAHTEWNGYRYCCCHYDVKPKNSYVIDEKGYSMFRNRFKHRYNIKGVRVHRNEKLRTEAVGEERTNRDKGKFVLHNGEFDWNIHNNANFRWLRVETNGIIKEFFGE